MTIAVANVANTNTFLFWQSITNQVAFNMSTAVVTTTANSTSAQTAGNAAISGTFFANIHLANTITANSLMWVGNSTVNAAVNSSSLSIVNSTVTFTVVAPTSTQVSNGQYFLNANGSYAVVSLTTITPGTATTTGTTQQTVDQWPLATYRAAEYLLNVWDNNANNKYTSKLTLMHDTASAWLTEYSQITTNSAVGVFAATVSGANVVLQFTPVSSNATVRFARTII
jgi:hypothetical protein